MSRNECNHFFIGETERYNYIYIDGEKKVRFGQHICSIQEMRYEYIMHILYSMLVVII